MKLKTLILLLMSFVILNAEDQVFKLKNREYRLIEGKWYNFSSGVKGDQIGPQRIIIKMKNEGDPKKFDFNNIGVYNVEVASHRMLGGYYLLKIGENQDPFKAAILLSENKNFVYVEFDALGKFSSTPADLYFSQQWNLSKIQMENAWDITTGVILQF